MYKDTNPADRLSLMTKICFGSGDILGGSMIIVGTLYLIFLTDVVRISPFLAGIILLTSKIWGAVFDPFFGHYTDRMQTPMGRRRPFFLISIPLIALSFFLLWYSPGFENSLSRFAYSLCTYIIFTTVMGIVTTSYNAFSTEITMDYHERTSAMSIRMVFGMGSVLLCAVIPMEIIKHFYDKATGYWVMSLIFGIAFALPYIAVFLSTKERRTNIASHKKSFRFTDFFEPFKIKTFRKFIISVTFIYLALDLIMALIVYYMSYYINKPGITNYMIGTLVAIQILMIPFYVMISKRKGKGFAFITGAAFWAFIMVAGIILKPGFPVIVFYFYTAFIGLGMAGVMAMVYAIYPDMPDIDDLFSKERREGLYAGIFIFIRKLSSASILFLLSLALEFAGYKPPIGNIPQLQDQSFIITLRVMFIFIPVIFLLASIASMRNFPLSAEAHYRLKRFLISRRKSDNDNVEVSREEEPLKKLLG